MVEEILLTQQRKKAKYIRHSGKISDIKISVLRIFRELQKYRESKLLPRQDRYKTATVTTLVQCFPLVLISRAWLHRNAHSFIA